MIRPDGLTSALIVKRLAFLGSDVQKPRRDTRGNDGVRVRVGNIVLDPAEVLRDPCIHPGKSRVGAAVAPTDDACQRPAIADFHRERTTTVSLAAVSS